MDKKNNYFIYRNDFTFIKVLENGMTTMKLSGRRNGNNPKRFQYISSTDIVTVRFASDKNTRKKGFHLLYRRKTKLSFLLGNAKHKKWVIIIP